MLSYKTQYIASEGASFSATPYLVVGKNSLGHSWRESWHATKAEALDAVRQLKLAAY